MEQPKLRGKKLLSHTARSQTPKDFHLFFHFILNSAPGNNGRVERKKKRKKGESRENSFVFSLLHLPTKFLISFRFAEDSRASLERFFDSFSNSSECQSIFTSHSSDMTMVIVERKDLINKAFVQNERVREQNFPHTLSNPQHHSHIITLCSHAIVLRSDLISLHSDTRHDCLCREAGVRESSTIVPTSS